LKFDFFQTTLDGEITKTKVVNPENLFNFVVDNFFYLKSSIQGRSDFSNLKLNFFKTTLDGETTKTKVIGIEKLFNFFS